LGDTNYKETQLARSRRAKASFTSIPTWTIFQGKGPQHHGRNGLRFSLFPPENATGNYVKVVQRIPVKIVLEEGADPETRASGWHVRRSYNLCGVTFSDA
jgi:membrane fusion protein (multidrug efflux system)